MFGSKSYIEDINIIKDYVFNKAKLFNSNFFFEFPTNNVENDNPNSYKM